MSDKKGNNYRERYGEWALVAGAAAVNQTETGATIVLYTNAGHVQVIKDGGYVGFTPDDPTQPFQFPSESGKHVILLSKTGYEMYTTYVNLSPNEVLTLRITLTAAAATPSPTTTATVTGAATGTTTATTATSQVTTTSPSTTPATSQPTTAPTTAPPTTPTQSGDFALLAIPVVGGLGLAAFLRRK